MENKRISTTANPIKVNTLGMDIELPDGATVSTYSLKHQKKQTKDSKQR